MFEQPQYHYPTQDPLVSMLMANMPAASGMRAQTPDMLDGLPLPGGPLARMFGQMFALPHVQRTMQQNNLVFGGINAQGQNLYDYQRNIQEQQTLTDAYRMTAPSQSYALEKLYGPAGGAAANAVLPVLSMMSPKYAELGGGPSGTAYNFMNAAFDTTRAMSDPITGQRGLTAESLASLTSTASVDLYQLSDPRRMRNVTQGEFGQMFDFMARERRIDQPFEGMSRKEQVVDVLERLRQEDPNSAETVLRNSVGFGQSSDIRKMDFNKQLSEANVEKIFGSEVFQNQARSISSEEMVRGLEPYKELVSAMKDIFGADGNPNAPIPEIMAGIEALTGGSHKVSDMKKAALDMRTTANLAKAAGMSSGERNAVYMQSAQLAEAAGLDSSFGQNFAQEYTAFKASFDGSTHGWGDQKVDELASAAMNMRANAENSQMNNELGTFMRLAVNSRSANLTNVSGEAKDIYDAVVANSENRATQEQKDLVSSLTPDQLQQIAARDIEGVTEAGYNTARNDRFSNSQISQRYSTGDLVFETQRREYYRKAATEGTQAMRGAAIEKLGLRENEQESMNKTLMAVSTDMLENLTKEDLDISEDGVYRNYHNKFQKTFEQKLAEGDTDEDKAVAFLYNQMTDDEKRAFSISMAEQSRGAMNTSVRDEIPGVSNLKGMVSMYGKKEIEDQERVKREQKAVAEAQTEVTGFTKGGIGETLMAALDSIEGPATDENGRMTPEASKAVGIALGGIDVEELSDQLAPMVKETYDLKKEYVRNVNDMSPGGKDLTDAERESMTQRQEEIRTKLGQYEKIIGPILTSNALSEVDMGNEEYGKLIASADLYASKSEEVLEEVIGSREDDGRRQNLISETSNKSNERFQSAEALRGIHKERFEKAIMGSEEIRRSLSAGTIDAYETAQASSRRMKTLADLFTDGDVGVLASGNVKFDKEAIEKAGFEGIENVQDLRDQILGEVDADKGRQIEFHKSALDDVSGAKKRHDDMKEGARRRYELMKEHGFQDMEVSEDGTLRVTQKGSRSNEPIEVTQRTAQTRLGLSGKQFDELVSAQKKHVSHREAKKTYEMLEEIERGASPVDGRTVRDLTPTKKYEPESEEDRRYAKRLGRSSESSTPGRMEVTGTLKIEGNTGKLVNTSSMPRKID